MKTSSRVNTRSGSESRALLSSPARVLFLVARGSLECIDPTVGVQPQRQLGCSWGNMDKAWPLDKFAQHLEALVDIPEPVLRQQLFPFRFRAFKLRRQRRGTLVFFSLGFQKFVENPAD